MRLAVGSRRLPASPLRPRGEALQGPDGLGLRPDLESAAPPVGPSQPAPPSRGPPVFDSNVTPASVRYVLSRMRWGAAVRSAAAPVSGRLCGGVGGPVCGVPRPTASDHPPTGPPFYSGAIRVSPIRGRPPRPPRRGMLCAAIGAGTARVSCRFLLPEGGVEVAGVGGGGGRRPGRHWQTPLVRLRGDAPVPTATSSRAARVFPGASSAGVAALACALAGGGRWEGGHTPRTLRAPPRSVPPPPTPPPR